MCKFTKVSEWVEAGVMSTSYLALENEVVKETEKAIAFKVMKTKSCGFGGLIESVCWLPKSSVMRVVNDFYTVDAPNYMYLVKHNILSKKIKDGYAFLIKKCLH